MEEARRLGVQISRSYDDEFGWDELHRLDTLWNIDKHRRLTLMAWWPDLIYWGSNRPSNRRAFPGDGTVADGSVLLYIEGSDEGMGDELSHEFNIVLTDDPAWTRERGSTPDVVGLLDRWHWHIVRVVFTRVFSIMSRP